MGRVVEVNARPAYDSSPMTSVVIDHSLDHLNEAREKEQTNALQMYLIATNCSR
jgi:hypothetical protein